MAIVDTPTVCTCSVGGVTCNVQGVDKTETCLSTRATFGIV